MFLMLLVKGDPRVSSSYLSPEQSVPVKVLGGKDQVDVLESHRQISSKLTDLSSRREDLFSLEAERTAN